jgi:hypothetical protein
MAKYWYRVDVSEGDKSRPHCGSSELDPDQLIQHLKSGQYLVLSDLFYRDNQNRMVAWSTWDPRLSAVAYINPAFVTPVMPFIGDPRGKETDSS